MRSNSCALLADVSISYISYYFTHHSKWIHFAVWLKKKITLFCNKKKKIIVSPSFSLYAVVTWLIILQDWEHAFECDCCSSASSDQRSRHGSSVPEHMILWHKHQFDYTTLIRAWIDDWQEGGGLEGVVGDSLQRFAYRTALHHQPQILKVNTFCMFILTLKLSHCPCFPSFSV